MDQQLTVAKRPRGRPPGATANVLGDTRALSQAHANFVRSVLLHSTSTMDLVQVAKRYLGHQLEQLHGNAIPQLARDLYRSFLAAAPGAIDEFHRRSQGGLNRAAASTATELERAVARLSGIDPLTAGTSPTADPPSPTATSRQLPTLDEWIAQYEAEHPHVDLGEFSEGELMEMYQDELGLDLPQPSPDPRATSTPSKAHPDPATLARDFMFLAGYVAVAPRPGDACYRWLAPAVANALLKAAPPVSTLEDLVEFIRRRGNRWWTHVPGLGVARALRVQAWLQEVAEGFRAGDAPSPTLPLPVGAKASEAAFKRLGLGRSAYGLLLSPAERQSLPKRQGIAPVEFLELRPSLDADTAAIATWLRGFGPQSSTCRAYHLALERLVIWLHCRGEPSLSGLGPEHMVEFLDFLSNPPAEWCTAARPHRYDLTWRPMRARVKGARIQAGLSGASLAQNAAAIRSFFEWANGNGWSAKPFGGVAPKPKTTADR